MVPHDAPHVAELALIFLAKLQPDSSHDALQYDSEQL
jgi:hypothetical protein